MHWESDNSIEHVISLKVVGALIQWENLGWHVFHVCDQASFGLSDTVLQFTELGYGDLWSARNEQKLFLELQLLIATFDCNFCGETCGSWVFFKDRPCSSETQQQLLVLAWWMEVTCCFDWCSLCGSETQIIAQGKRFWKRYRDLLANRSAFLSAIISIVVNISNVCMQLLWLQ